MPSDGAADSDDASPPDAQAAPDAAVAVAGEAERARLQRVAGDAVSLADEWLFMGLFARGLLPPVSEALTGTFLRLMASSAQVVRAPCCACIRSVVVVVVVVGGGGL